MSLVTNKYLEQKAVASGQLDTMCSEMFRRTPLKLFTYARFNRDRELIFCGNRADVDAYYMMQQAYLTEFAHRQYEDIPSGSYFSTLIAATNEEIELHKTMVDSFKLDNFLSIIRHNDDCVEIYNFACDSECKDAANFYLNNVNMLTRYVDVFKEPIKRILQTNRLQPLLIPYENENSAQEIAQDYHSSQYTGMIESALTGVKSVPDGSSEQRLAGKSASGRLTARELDCLRLIARGMTSKEIARSLSLSFRTVENYCERIKTKLGCRRKQDLIVQYANAFDS